MRVFIFSDGHGDVDKLKRVKSEIAASDIVLFAGDFTKFGICETGIAYMNALLDFNKPTFSVMGNCDYPRLFEKLRQNKVAVDGTVRQYEHIWITGSGGGSIFTKTSPYERTDEELVSDLEKAKQQLEEKMIVANRLIVLAHNPPADTKLDVVKGNIHVGSPRLRQFVETYEPLLLVSGHIHESVGVETLGKTTMVNPGALVDGHFAVCELVEHNGVYSVHGLSIQ